MEKQETILDESKNIILREEATEFVEELIKKDIQLYYKSAKLLNKLGLGGCWIGRDLALYHIAITIKNNEVMNN